MRSECKVLLVYCSAALYASTDCLRCIGMRGKQGKQRIGKTGTNIIQRKQQVGLMEMIKLMQFVKTKHLRSARVKFCKFVCA